MTRHALLAITATALATAIGGEEAGQLFEGDRRFDLVVRLPEEMRQDPAALGDLPIALGGGGGSVAAVQSTKVH